MRFMISQNLILNTFFMNRKLSLIFFLPILLLLASGNADEKIDRNAIPGKLIIQFPESGNQKSSIESLEQSFSFAGLSSEKCLSQQLGIWLMAYDTESVSDQILLKQLKRSELVASVQFNHRISLREFIPDDPEFHNQWALKNTGQSGGIEDADIDGTDAWDISSNTGTSVFGDTVVMAIVDDGFAMGHEDMNYWKNRQEIPNNGLDDDDNGYVDDYDGWNAYYHSGYIQPKDHGQHVAGIAGARGNNGLGVCGVNWNGRVMTVAGSSTIESTVVEAYGYVYKMRSLYDETNGEKGAYVVVTNSSFGVDLGDPDDYPIWGAMYDSLGSLGILSVGSTINGIWNVDEAGDVPTSFTSDFLIAVTNTTNKDEKNLAAGYGPISIDLGAPGRGILSTKIPNTYGYLTGTSMSAPQVTGSIALMFSSADASLMQRYSEEPEILAVFMKNVLLDGVDQLPGFDTLCASGGRLNVNNALQILLNPRIGLPFDTLHITIAPDSVKQEMLVINNLVGFELPYEVSIEDMPDWINFSPGSGILQGDGTADVIIDIDAYGLYIGMYSTEIIFTDIAGMATSVIIEMEVKYPQAINDIRNVDEPNIRCYPNPFTSELNVSIELHHSTEFSLNIYSVDGQLIKSWEEKDVCGVYQVTWDGTYNGQELSSGIYILQLRVNGRKESIKVIKQ
jgi:hypothetical protein